MINDLDNTKDTINHLSLCTGYEGVGIGLRRVLPNLREIAYVEREGYVAALLAKKMEEGELDPAPIHTDVKTFPYGRFLGQVDILSAGFPCQPFSSAGERQSTEDPRHLFPFILEGIKQCRPKFVFLENVEGIISSKTKDGESVLKYVLRSLEQVGYTTTAGVFSAAEVGATHQRKRVYILGNSNEWNVETRRRRPRAICEEGKRQGVSSDATCSSKTLPNYPSSPNERQHSWEAPRVINTKILPKPKLGRATNGSKFRLDRLRILGNGVVPATAERAFRVLTNRLMK